MVKWDNEHNASLTKEGLEHSINEWRRRVKSEEGKPLPTPIRVVSPNVYVALVHEGYVRDGEFTAKGKRELFGAE